MRLPTSNTAVWPTMIPPGLSKMTVPPGPEVPSAGSWRRLSTVPSKWIGTSAWIRFSTAKLPVLAPLMKVAVRPAGRKTSGLPPTFGTQRMIALDESRVIVSTPGVARS